MSKAGMTLIIFSLLAPLAALAQESGEHRGLGYAYFAPGASSPGGTGTFQTGAGGEGLVYKGLGVGGELGYVAPWRSARDGLGVASANGSYHFSRRKKLDPFVTGGYTLFFRSGHANLFNVGGGVDYWFRERLGLRLEIRDQVWPSQYGTTGHFWGVRIGIAFR